MHSPSLNPRRNIKVKGEAKSNRTGQFLQKYSNQNKITNNFCDGQIVRVFCAGMFCKVRRYMLCYSILDPFSIFSKLQCYATCQFTSSTF